MKESNNDFMVNIQKIRMQGFIGSEESSHA